MYIRDKLIPYRLCYSQYQLSIWLLNCNDYSDISSVCRTTWQLATVASHVACSIQDAAIWLVEVPLAANSRKGEYHGCWCAGSLCRQDISNHGIDYAGSTGTCPRWVRLSATYWLLAKPGHQQIHSVWTCHVDNIQSNTIQLCCVLTA